MERTLGRISSEDSVPNTLAEVPCSPEGPGSISWVAEYGFYDSGNTEYIR